MSEKASVLIVEDDPLFRLSLQRLLSPQARVFQAGSLAEAQQVLQKELIHCVLLDLHLGPENSQPFISEWKTAFPHLEILVLSGQPEIKIAMDCLRAGAADYLVKPLEPELLLHVLGKSLERQRMKRSLEKLETLIQPQPVSCVGSSKPLQKLIEKIRLLKNRTQLNILILGESGTGKEILARYLHQQEDDPKRPFVVANMPAIPGNLMEAELFGVEKGAFTDAKCARPGKFELADSGDIFLDEIGDLPLEMQSKMLRVLQERQIQRLGSQKVQSLKFRVISATNQPLAEMVKTGKFREDLLYRLGDVVLCLPPLRERKEDIPSLVEHFVKKHAIDSPPEIDSSVMAQLVAYDWPGNIRQLESTIKRALVFSTSHRLSHIEIYDFVHLAGSAHELREETPLKSQIQQVERSAIEGALKKHSRNRHRAMRELGMSKATFYRKLQQFGISQSDA